MVETIYSAQKLTELAKLSFQQERAKTRLDGWFEIKEIECKKQTEYASFSLEMQKALVLKDVANVLKITIGEHQIFAGTQDDAFAKSYALINPTFKVEEFSGYCDPSAVFNDIEPNDEYTKERILQVKDQYSKSEYVQKLGKVYEEYAPYTQEVAFFMEQVTGHLIPDFRYALQHGVQALMDILQTKNSDEAKAMKIALEAVLILAKRYQALATEQMKTATKERKQQLELMANTLEKVPQYGASSAYEAMQAYILLWQVMCIEQSPNPFAFSVGNADVIFEPFRNNLSREMMKGLLEHFLVFFNVADRSWAISQNLIIGGKSVDGKDLTNVTSYALLDAYYSMNMPQPILSVKLHKNSPDQLYQELGKFFFTPGMLTPSLFNVDALFEVLKNKGIDEEDLVDIAVAGCQEPLIMGKDNGNTTNSWLNLPKILELTLTGGQSLISGKHLFEVKKANANNIRETFYENTSQIIQKMVEAANGASVALSELRVPFLSAFMGGVESETDLRNPQKQGTKYNGSGCLVHGASVVADSFVAIETWLKNNPQNEEDLVKALQNNFVGYEDLHKILKDAPKFGNFNEQADSATCEVIEKVATMIECSKNYLGNSFRPDFSSPSTHLLYGYWVGATPDGRKAREMLGYGVDPLYGCAENGLGYRMLSNMQLPFEKMSGGYASHLGVDPKYFNGKTLEDKGIEFKQKILEPLFFNENITQTAPFYLYVNVTSPETLRKVLENPKKYAPSGIYIMRIHGTFVNFLDLSPAIQQDIIKRLDPKSTTLE